MTGIATLPEMPKILSQPTNTRIRLTYEERLSTQNAKLIRRQSLCSPQADIDKFLPTYRLIPIHIKLLNHSH